MKRNRKWIVISIFLIIIFLFFYLIQPSNIKTAGKDYNLRDKLLIQSEPDLFGENSLKITEKELNSLIADDLSVKLQNKLPDNIVLKGLYIKLTQNNINIQTAIKVKIIPVGLNFKLQPVKNNGKIAFNVVGIQLGRLKLPLLFLKLSRTFKNNIYYPDDSYKLVSLININNLYCFNNEIEVRYTFNRDAIINSYLEPEYREALKSILKTLNNNQVSREFANDLFRAFIIIGKEGELPNNLIEKIKKDFDRLDFNTKKELLFLLLKYNLQIIKNIL